MFYPQRHTDCFSSKEWCDSHRSLWIHNKNGFALFSVLITILILTALTSVTILRASTGSKVTYATTLRQHAFYHADRALWSGLRSTNVVHLQSLPIDETITTTTHDNDTQTRFVTTRLDSTHFWFVATAATTRGSHRAEHRVALSARLTQNVADSTMILVPLAPYAWVDFY